MQHTNVCLLACTDNNNASRLLKVTIFIYGTYSYIYIGTVDRDNEEEKRGNNVLKRWYGIEKPTRHIFPHIHTFALTHTQLYLTSVEIILKTSSIVHSDFSQRISHVFTEDQAPKWVQSARGLKSKYTNCENTKKAHTRYFYTLQTDILDNQFVCHNAISYFSFRSCDVGCTIKCSSDIFCNSSSSYFASRTLHFTFYHFFNYFYNSLW